MSARRSSLAFRLLAGVLLFQLLLAAGLVWAGIVFTRRELRAAFDARLRARLMGVAALVRYPETGATLVFSRELLPPPPPARHPDFYAVSRSGGATIASTLPAQVALPDEAAAATGAGGGRFWNFTVRGVPYRGLEIARQPILDTEENLTGPPARLTVAYAAPTEEIRREVAAAGIAIGGTSLALLCLTSLLAGFTIRRELDPLRDLARQAAAISPGHWRLGGEAGLRPRTASTAELAPLVAALELMLQRLQQSFQRQREFMADAAHELKTPVTILKSTLQSLLRRRRTEEEYRAAALASLQDTERLEGLLQRMLRLAQAERWAERPTGESREQLPPTDLGATCENALTRMRPLAEAAGVVLRGAAAAGVLLRADPDDLELIWLNLLENAVQHSPPGAAVELTLRATEAGCEVLVRDCGYGIAPADLPFIFDRFRRGDDARRRHRQGAGLGLSIVRAMVHAYGGEIAAKSRPGAETVFRVAFPRTAAEE